MTQTSWGPFQGASQQPQQGFISNDNPQYAGNVSSTMAQMSSRYLRAVNAFWASYGDPGKDISWSMCEGQPPEPISERETVQYVGGSPMEWPLSERYATTNIAFAELGSQTCAGLASPIGTQGSAQCETMGDKSVPHSGDTSVAELNLFNFAISGIEESVTSAEDPASSWLPLSGTSAVDQPIVSHDEVDTGIAPSQLIRPTSEEVLMVWLRSPSTIPPVTEATTAGDGDATPQLISSGTSITDTDTQPQPAPKAAAASSQLEQVASEDHIMALLFTSEPGTLPAGGHVTDLYPSQSEAQSETISQQKQSVTPFLPLESDLIPTWPEEAIKEADIGQCDAKLASCLTKDGTLSSTQFSPDNGDSIPNRSSLLSWLKSPERGLSARDTSILEYMLLNMESSTRHGLMDALQESKCILPEQVTDLSQDSDRVNTTATQQLVSESSDGEDFMTLVNWNPCVVPSRGPSAEAERYPPLSSGATGPTQVVTPQAAHISHMDIDKVGGDGINETEANLNPEPDAIVAVSDPVSVTSGSDDNGGNLNTDATTSVSGGVPGEVGLGSHLKIDTMTGAGLDVGAIVDETEMDEAHSSPYLKPVLNDAVGDEFSMDTSGISEDTIVVCLERSRSHPPSLSCSVSNREPTSPPLTESLSPSTPSEVSTPVLPFANRFDLLGPDVNFIIDKKRQHKSWGRVSKIYKEWPDRVGSTSPGALRTRVWRMEQKWPWLKEYLERRV